MYAQQCCNVKGLCLAICWSHPQCILLIAVKNAGLTESIGRPGVELLTVSGVCVCVCLWHDTLYC